MTESNFTHTRCSVAWHLYFKMVYDQFSQNSVANYNRHVTDCAECQAWMDDAAQKQPKPHDEVTE